MIAYCKLCKCEFQTVHKVNQKVKTIGLRCVQGERVKWVLSYSRALNKKGWVNSDFKRVRFGFLKSRQLIFIARAFIIGNHKFSILNSTKNK